MSRPVRVMSVGPVTMPIAIAGLIATVAAVSIACAIAGHNGLPQLPDNALLVPSEVWRGQAWRLLTFSLLEMTPLGLLLGCLMLYWWGADLALSWGATRFVATYFALGAAAGIVTCLVARLWPPLALLAFDGASPVLGGLVVAWGLMFPAREIRLFNVLRIKGRWMVGISIGATLLFAIFYGFASFVPHFAAELLVLVWLGVWRPWRVGRRHQRIAAAARGEGWSFDRWYEREKQRRPRVAKR